VKLRDLLSTSGVLVEEFLNQQLGFRRVNSKRWKRKDRT